MSIQEAIKTIVLNGGGVTVPYKSSPKKWFSEVKISRIDWQHESWIIINGADITYEKGKFKVADIDAAIKLFVEKVYTKKNLAHAYEGIIKHKLTDVDLDDLNDSQLRRLVKKYNDKYFAQDYPEFAENV